MKAQMNLIAATVMMTMITACGSDNGPASQSSPKRDYPTPAPVSSPVVAVPVIAVPVESLPSLEPEIVKLPEEFSEVELQVPVAEELPQLEVIAEEILLPIEIVEEEIGVIELVEAVIPEVIEEAIQETVAPVEVEEQEELLVGGECQAGSRVAIIWYNINKPEAKKAVQVKCMKQKFALRLKVGKHEKNFIVIEVKSF